MWLLGGSKCAGAGAEAVELPEPTLTLDEEDRWVLLLLLLLVDWRRGNAALAEDDDPAERFLFSSLSGRGNLWTMPGESLDVGVMSAIDGNGLRVYAVGDTGDDEVVDDADETEVCLE